MYKNTNNLAVTDHFLEVIFNSFLSQIIGPLLGSLCEGLLLAAVPAPHQSKKKDEFKGKAPHRIAAMSN